MSKDHWYYVKDGSQMGPVHENELRKLFGSGNLAPETLVWSDTMADWTPASETEAFRNAIALSRPPAFEGSPPPLPRGPTVQVVDLDVPEDREVPQIRPWVRYWARMVDLSLAGFVFGAGFLIAVPAAVAMPDVLFGMLLMFVWVFVEALLLSSWGTTPGKWLLATRVRDSAGRVLTFSEGLKRSFSVWLRGLGLGIPLVALVTLIVAHGKLKKDGVTTWDRKGGFVVSHRKIGALRIIIVILVLFVFLCAFVMGEAVARCDPLSLV